MLNWCFIWLSHGDRLTLVKSVLESIHVYWFSLTHIPKGMFDKIRKKRFHFFADWETGKGGDLFGEMEKKIQLEGGRWLGT